MADGPVRVELRERVGRIVLSRPDRLNALTLEVQQAILDAAGELSAEPDVRVVVVGGDGGTFTSGADLGLLAGFHGAGAVERDDADLGRRMIDAVAAIPAVTIARIEGHCVGGGVVLAAACDLRYAADDTYFSIPEVDLGIPLGWGGVPRMVRAIGAARTLELVGTCRSFSAADAFEWGFLTAAVARRDLGGVVDGVAGVLAAKPEYALRQVTRTVRDAAESMAPAMGMTGDADLLLGAIGNEESAAAARSYLERFGRARD